jgi:hypothetical protein
MNWKKEVKFQRDQFLGMIPKKDDVILFGFSAIFTLSFLIVYWCFAVIIGAIFQVA